MKNKTFVTTPGIATASLMIAATALTLAAAVAAPPAPSNAPAPAPATRRSVAEGPDPKEIPLPDIRGPLGALPGPEGYKVQKDLPDPMIMNDGTKVTTPEQWKVRREEIKKILAYYAMGQMPPAPGNVKGKELRSEIVAGGKVKYRLVHLTFGPQEKLFLDVGIFTPNREGKFPAIIMHNTWANEDESPPGAVHLARLPNGPTQGRSQDILLVVGPPHEVAPAGTPAPAAVAAPPAPPATGPAETAGGRRGGRGGGRGGNTAESIATQRAELFERGYALAMYNSNDCAEDTTLREMDGSFSFRHTRFFPAYPGYDWGVLAGWAWGGSRVADYLETDPAIDSKTMVITGWSRTGKSSMMAAAFDDRLIGAPVVTGGGGVGAYRPSGVGRGGGEGLGEMCNKYPNWFGPNLHQFWTHTDQLPFDNHWFLALCAPRTFICLEGTTDGVSLPLAVKATVKAAWPVYEFLGVRDHLGVNYANHGHAFTGDDFSAIMDITDKTVFNKKIDRTFTTFLPTTPDWKSDWTPEMYK